MDHVGTAASAVWAGCIGPRIFFPPLRCLLPGFSTSPTPCGVGCALSLLRSWLHRGGRLAWSGIGSGVPSLRKSRRLGRPLWGCFGLRNLFEVVRWDFGGGGRYSFGSRGGGRGWHGRFATGKDPSTALGTGFCVRPYTNARFARWTAEGGRPHMVRAAGSPHMVVAYSRLRHGCVRFGGLADGCFAGQDSAAFFGVLPEMTVARVDWFVGDR